MRKTFSIHQQRRRCWNNNHLMSMAIVVPHARNSSLLELQFINNNNNCRNHNQSNNNNNNSMLTSVRRHYSSRKESFLKTILGIKNKAEDISNHLKEERRELFAQSSKLTSFREAQEFMWHEGKSLEAFPILLPKNRCFIFPSAPKQCISLNTDMHLDIPEYIVRNNIKACMVTVTFTAFSAEMAKTWIEPFYEAFRQVIRDDTSSNIFVKGNEDDDDVVMPRSSSSVITRLRGPASSISSQPRQAKLFDLSVANGTFLRFMKSSILKSMKKSTPQHMIDHTLACYPDPNEQRVLDYFSARLDITNTKNCYVFLLDEDAKVRWRAVGNATEKELAILKKLTVQLLNGEK